MAKIQLKSDSIDPDGSLRNNRYEQVVKQADRYFRAVMDQIGGIYLKPVKAGVSSCESALPVPASAQKASLLWVLRQFRDISWLSFESTGGIRTASLEHSDVLLFNIASDLFSTWENVILSSYLAGEDGFSLEDWISAIDSEIFAGRPDRRMMTVQKIYVASLISAATKKTSISKLSLLADEYDSLQEEEAFGPAGYKWMRKVNIKAINNSKEIFAYELTVLDKKLRKSASRTSDKTLKAHYLSLSKEIGAALE